MTITDQALLEEKLQAVRGYVIDMDGVLYRGNERLPWVVEFLDVLTQSSIPFVMGTNNSTRSAQQYTDKLAKMGIEVSPERIFTSSMATREMLRHKYSEGTKVYVVGMDALQEAIFGDGYFAEAGKDAEIVVQGADFELTYEKLRIATLAIRAGATYVATNGDTTFPSEEGIIPGAGAIIAALVAATGVTPHIVGKPSTSMLIEGAVYLGTKPGETAMLGDRLDTDILAGVDAEFVTILVMTGVTDAAELKASPIVPDVVIPDLKPLVAYYTS